MSALEHAEIIDAEPGAALAVRAPVALSVTPDVKAKELTERLDVIREAMTSAMVENVDYGKVPGTDKPTLLKPGAEKLGVLFQLDVQLVNEKEREAEHLTVTSHATVWHAPTGARLGYGEGMCSTYEKKYRYRQAERVCPSCQQPAIIKGKAEYGGGWVCFKKKGGCGAKYDDRDQQIVSQKVGQVENPDLPDLWNTVLKMAEKRARVDAILAVTGASALFTQDVEDQEPDVVEGTAFRAPADVPDVLVAPDDEDPERDRLAGELLRLAHELGAFDATASAIAKNRKGKPLPEHKAWLLDQILKAEKKLGRQGYRVQDPEG